VATGGCPDASVRQTIASRNCLLLMLRGGRGRLCQMRHSALAKFECVKKATLLSIEHANTLSETFSTAVQTKSELFFPRSAQICELILKVVGINSLQSLVACF
jgi:hypothetical protein